MIRTAAILVLAMGALVVRPAAAQSAVEAEARSHFEAGYAYYEEARYQDALTEFSRAYDLSSRPALLFNMSQTHERLGNAAEAIVFLERFIGETTNEEDRAFQERRLANLREQQAGAAAGHEAVSTVPPSEIIAPDSARDVAAGTQAQVPPDDVAVDVPPVETGVEPPPPESSGSGHGLAYAFLGVGAAGVLTLGVAGAMALSEKSRLQSDCADGCPRSETESLRTRALVADIGLGVALAGTLVGVILLFTGGSDAPEETASVAPMVSRNGGGAALSLRY